MSSLRAQEFTTTVDDLSGGIVGGVNERRLNPRHLRRGNNLIGRPYRAMSARPGSRDISSAVLGAEPHSLMKFYGTSPRVFVASADDIHEVQAAAYVPQTLPFTPSSSEIWTHENLNGVLWATQRFGVQLPIFFDGTSWKEMKLPKPAAAPTFAADSAGGNVDAGTHYYRVRWRYANGSSLVGPVSAARVVAGPNFTVNINANLVPGAPRGDYLGWTLERTKVGGAATGPFYFVADGTAATYADTSADADLFYLADEGLHGEPPHLDGLVAAGDRLIGWAGSTLYLSQTIADEEGTGLCNWDAELQIPVAKDDGDTIQSVLVIGDRKLVLKKRSAHVLDGTEPESFLLTPIGAGSAEAGGEVGCVGPRAATSVAGDGYFFGDGGLFRFRGGRIHPLGWVEVGHYKDEFNQAELDQILLVNYLGDLLLVAYPIGANTYNSELVVYDLRFNNWDHWTNWRMRDAIVQKDGGFSGATLIFCDPKATEDVPGAGSASSFYAWSDTRGATTEAFVQKLNAVGAPQWAANGVQVSASAGTPADVDPLLCSDGEDGCIVLWYDDRVAGAGPGFYIQRLDGAGAEQWTAGGIFVNAVSAQQIGNRALLPDGLGGCMVVVGGVGVITAYRFDSTGFTVATFSQGVFAGAGHVMRPDSIAWNADIEMLFVVVRTPTSSFLIATDFTGGAAGFSITPVHTGTIQVLKVIHNDSGGAIVCWSRSDVGSGDIYARLYTAAGPQWGGPVAICTAAGAQGPGEFDLRMVPDGAGGAIIAWADDRTGDRAVYAQRVNNGTVRWAVNGVPVCSVAAADAGEYLTMVPDASGGAIIAWNDTRAGNDNIFAQRIDGNGLVQWTANGVSICAAAGRQYLVSSAVDGLGGAMISWVDERAGAAADDVFAQRINAAGAVAWAANGVAVGAAANTQIGRGIAVDDTEASTLGYRVWAGMSGFLDERKVDETGGMEIPHYIEHPFIDCGTPGLVKSLRRLQLYVDADAVDMTVSLLLEPGGRSVVVPVSTANAGDDWAEDTPHPGDLEWDVGDWAADGATPITVPLPQGTLCQRYSLRLSFGSRAPVVYSGHEMTGHVLPGRRMDR